jgi:sodium/pantothenate symporter
MLIIFLIYSVIIVGLGFYVRFQTKKGNSNNLANFLTGGGGLGAFSIAMIAATNSMAGGTMIAAPGLGYAIGFTAALIYYGGFLTAAYGLGAVGKKVAILRDRTKAVSFLQIMRLRFQSKAIVGALAFTGTFGMIFFACGQITAGSKVFAAVTGSNNYYFGLLLVVVITLLYTMSGGIKSLAKIAVIQGIIMLMATFSVIGVLLYRNTLQYGSIQNAIQYLGTTMPRAIQAQTAFTFWNALGTALFAGIGLGVLPNALSVTMVYNKHRNLKRGIIISCCVFTLVQGIMCFTGPLVRLINPDLVIRDNTTIFVATNLLPTWIGGIIFCGIFAAIQSTIAALCIASGAAIAKDFIIDCIKPDMPKEKQNNLNLLVILVVGFISTLIALKPTDLTQYMINFALGAICSAWYWPILCAIYWKKATRIGMLSSIICGYFSYILFYFLSSVIPETRTWWISNMGGVNAFVPAWIISLLFMIIGSLATQHDKVKFGYFQVFFCDQYDDKYALMK